MYFSSRRRIRQLAIFRLSNKINNQIQICISMKVIKIILCLFFLSSCKKSEEISNSDDYFYGFVRSSNENKNPLLKIKTQYDECGEWGGHNETITIFSKDNNLKLYAKFEETNADCESLGQYGVLNQNPVKTITREIDDSQKIEITSYLKKLVEFKSKCFVTGNSGMSYSAISQDSTFTIYIYSNNSECKRAFQKLKSKFNF